MDMDVLISVSAFVAVFAIGAVAAVKIARLRASRVAPEVTERLETVERTMHDLQQALAEAQERLDFTERLLSKAREERRIGS